MTVRRCETNTYNWQQEQRHLRSVPELKRLLAIYSTSKCTEAVQLQCVLYCASVEGQNQHDTVFIILYTYNSYAQLLFEWFFLILTSIFAFYLVKLKLEVIVTRAGERAF